MICCFNSVFSPHPEALEYLLRSIRLENDLLVLLFYVKNNLETHQHFIRTCIRHRSRAFTMNGSGFCRVISIIYQHCYWFYISRYRYEKPQLDSLLHVGALTRLKTCDNIITEEKGALQIGKHILPVFLVGVHKLKCLQFRRL